MTTQTCSNVTPADAGVQAPGRLLGLCRRTGHCPQWEGVCQTSQPPLWIPACAGMTKVAPCRHTSHPLNQDLGEFGGRHDDTNVPNVDSRLRGSDESGAGAVPAYEPPLEIDFRQPMPHDCRAPVGPLRVCREENVNMPAPMFLHLLE